MNTQKINYQFKSLKNGSTHRPSGIVGTNHDVRNLFWYNFTRQFPDTVTISVKGIPITFKANYSVSGKTITYFTSISKEDYISIRGDRFGLSRKGPYISIQYGVIILNGGRNFYDKIDNSLVEII